MALAKKQNVIQITPVTSDKVVFDDQGTIDNARTAEMVIALCGPLGTPLHEVATKIQHLLKSEYAYKTVEVIKLSDKIREKKSLLKSAKIKALIDAGNELREAKGTAVLARLAIEQITLAREKLQPDIPETAQPALFDTEPIGGAIQPTASERVCHIIDSIKNIDELRLLRSVYGEMLHVVGVYAPIDIRIERLREREGNLSGVYELIDRDSGEESAHGQRVEETFPQSDFFLRTDTNTDAQMTGRVKRFLDLVLGTRVITPTTHERAMYAAYSASRNSACLSRQVGAAITDEHGEILASGWNDVPKPFGGLYETLEPGSTSDADHRCWNKGGGRCFNDEEKTTIANTVVDKFVLRGLIDASKREEAFELIRRDSQLRSLIEFSRAVHAEMHALLNAGATFGNRIVRGRMYVTTYPCHSCARHIVAAGIKDVYFLEPYRKSLATKLHPDALTERESDENKVRLVPFDGVAPSRFLTLFSAWENGRKDPKTGRMQKKTAHPVTARTLEAVATLEAIAVKALESRSS